MNRRITINKFGLAGLLLLASQHSALAQEEISNSDSEIEEVFVSGRAQELYRTGETSTGKLPTEPLLSTQIITSINAELISDQGARDAQVIYRNIAGVSLFSYAGVTARGFRQEEIFFDGLRGDPYVGFNVPQLFNIEQVDFLKGPAGMLYGPGAPGGVFNYVTVKPSQDFSARLRGVLGSESRAGGSFEITGALPAEGTAGRFGVFYEDRDTPRRNSGSAVSIYDGGFSSEFYDNKLTLQATRYEQDLDGNRLRGVPVDDKGNFLTDPRWNHNEPMDFLDLESNNLQAKLEGEVGPSIIWDATLRYTDSEQAQQYHEPRALIDTDGDDVPDLVGREFRDQLREEEITSFGSNLTWESTIGDHENRLLVGMEYFDSSQTANLGGARFSAEVVERFLAGTSLATDILPLSLSNPDYGRSQSENYDVVFRPERVVEQQRSGVYLMD